MNITYFEMNRILNHVFNGGTGGSHVYTSGSLYLGLSTTDITISGGGLSEPSTAYGYARVNLPNKTTTWSVSTIGEVENLSDISFPESSQSWGTIHAVFLASGSSTTSGCVCYVHNVAPFTVAGAMTVSFSSGSVIVSMES